MISLLQRADAHMIKLKLWKTYKTPKVLVCLLHNNNTFALL